jgi:hypothetical protein
MDMMEEQPEDELLYHYCDAVAFEAIIRTNTLWLSPFRHSNDSEEGIRAGRLLAQLAVKYGLGEGEVASFEKDLNALSCLHDCYGLCLSQRGDLLSQWRGYAADGAGFAIGFRPAGLKSLPPLMAEGVPAPHWRAPVLHKIVYDEEEQLRELTPWFESMKDHVRDSRRPPPRQRLEDLASSSGLPKYMRAQRSLDNTLTYNWDRLYGVKSAAFNEEEEWRLVLWAFHFGGVPFKYRVSRGMVIPYLEYALSDRRSELSPISHIYLGPKNRTPIFIVQMMLSQFGLDEVTVSRSGASYR